MDRGIALLIGRRLAVLPCGQVVERGVALKGGPKADEWGPGAGGGLELDLSERPLGRLRATVTRPGGGAARPRVARAPLRSRPTGRRAGLAYPIRPRRAPGFLPSFAPMRPFSFEGTRTP